MIVNGLCSAAESCRVELSRPRQAQRIAKPASELPPETEKQASPMVSSSLCDSARRLSATSSAGQVTSEMSKRHDDAKQVGRPGAGAGAHVVLDRPEL